LLLLALTGPASCSIDFSQEEEGSYEAIASTNQVDIVNTESRHEEKTYATE
jgi:hypothetical protein